MNHWFVYEDETGGFLISKVEYDFHYAEALGYLFLGGAPNIEEALATVNAQVHGKAADYNG